MRTWIYGYFGHSNVGDEAILESVLTSVRRVGQEPFVFSNSLPASRRGLNARYVLAPPFDVESDLRGVKYKIGYWLRHGAHWLRPMLLERNVCIYACGGSINDHVPGRVTFVRNRVARLKALGFRVAILGAGVNHLVTTVDRSAAYETVATLLDYCSVRDVDSKDALLELNVPSERFHLATDAAFALETEERWTFRPGPLNTRRVGLNLRPLFESEEERGDNKAARRADYLSSVQDLIFELSERVGILELVALSPDDFEFLTRFECPPNVSVAPFSADRSAVMNRIASCDVFIGSRFHAFVFAIMAGVPCVAVPYSPKVVSLAQRVGIEHESLVVGDGGELADRSLDPHAVTRELARTWERAEEISARFLSLASEQRAIARDDFTRCWMALTR